MLKWKLKGCPRCGGDVFCYQDVDGAYEQCLQCGYQHELRILAKHDGKKVMV